MSTEPTIKQQLVDLVTGGKDDTPARFVGGRDAGGGVYLVPEDGPNVALFDGAAKEELVSKLYQDTGKIAGRKPIDEAWFVVRAGLRKLSKRRLPLRVGTHEGASVIDVGDETGEAIVIDTDGWKIVERSPITFTRTNTTMPMVEPVQGGDVNRLWEIVNVAPAHRRMLLGWMVAALTESISHTVMTLRGEQGAAKSTAARAIVRVLDPNAVDSSKPPKDEDRWDALCSAHWVVSIDNVSNVPPWWSDDLCRAVTGAGTEKRKLYTDSDVHASAFRRCVILNGITLGGMLRPDLLQRTMAFDLEPPAKRLTDAEVDDLITDALPEILGGLLDLAVEVRAAEVERPELPRMADFGLILTKLDSVLGDPPAGELGALDAFVEQLEELFDDSYQSDPVAQAVVALMAARTDYWKGTTAALLDALRQNRTIWDRMDGKGYWPDNATQLGHALTRSAPLLRQHGITVRSVKIGRGNDQQRGKLIEQRGHGDSGDSRSSTSVPQEERGEREVQERDLTVSTVPTAPTDDEQTAVVDPCPKCHARPLDAEGKCMDTGCGYVRRKRSPINIINEETS